VRLELTTLQLFSSFPRYVGNPHQKIVYDLYEFSNFIVENDGVHDCFTCVYDIQRNIDKIFYDLDGSESLKDAKVMYKYLTEKGYNVIPIASGSKGIHLYPLLKPKIYGDQAKDLLYKASISIVKNAFKGDCGKSVDAHVLGDVKRLCRIPNTMRPPKNRNWCTYLPEWFIDMNDEEFAKWIKEPHNINYEIKGKLPTLFDLIDEKLDDLTLRNLSDDSLSIKIGNGSNYLKNILRPCLYKHIVSVHPHHEIRVACTIDLLEIGLGEEGILSAYGTLGWEDWNEDYTKYQIKQINSMGYKKYSCKKLRMLGVPEICCVR
jgi:hypothetical protein